MKDYLCIEHGEFFIVSAKDFNEAKSFALEYGGEAIKEISNNE